MQEYSPHYHHVSIGFVERFIQTLLNCLPQMWAEEPKYFAKAVKQHNDTTTCYFLPVTEWTHRGECHTEPKCSGSKTKNSIT